MSKTLNLLTAREYFKPFSYQWAADAALLQNQMHWLPDEVPMADDVRDWVTKVTGAEKNLVTSILRFFVTGDIDVQANGHLRLAEVIRPPECSMMLSAFANMETIHILAYAHLIDTLGLPEAEYKAFLEYEEMKSKHDYFDTFNVSDKREIAKTLAAFGAFVEGVQLFSSFAILMNFSRFGKLKGVGQIVAFSAKDEDLHSESVIKLFKAFVKENREIWKDDLKREIYEIAETMVSHEDAFIDLAFKMGPIQGLSPEELKQYIRYIAGRKLRALGMKDIFRVKQNPLPWMEWMLGKEHTNFFEGRATAYSRGAMTGTWDDAWKVHEATDD